MGTPVSLSQNSKSMFLAAILGLLCGACGGGNGASPSPLSPQPPAIRSFVAQPPSVQAGQRVTFSWVVDGAKSLSIDGLGSASGSNLTFIPVTSDTYTLRATNALGQTTAQAQITVVAPEPASSMFPWKVPWDDATSSVTDIRGLIPAPAGANGFVRVEGGHLATEAGRIRFWGTNTTFEANFPSAAEADSIASHMAKSGINLVRLHHMDTSAAPRGIWSTLAPDRVISPQQLDRLDYFISRMKANGVYVDMNLLVGRPLSRGTDLPVDIDLVTDWKARHALGFFDPQIRELQKVYAHDLLTHVNPYTGNAYAQEPAVALVEIINENGLVQAFKNGQMDSLPSYYKGELANQWNTWLKAKYGTQTNLARAWHAAVISPPGVEMLLNGDFASGISPWNLEQHDTAQATVSIVANDVPAGQSQAAKIQILGQGTQDWHIQFSQGGLPLAIYTPYTLTFWAKSDHAQSINASVNMAHDPWANLGLSQTVPLTTSWQSFTYTFSVIVIDGNARVDFGGMGLDSGNVWITAVSLKPGGYLGLRSGEDLDAGSLQPFLNTGDDLRTPEGWKDWFTFLRDTEAAYWNEMQAHLKATLGVRALVIGTIVGNSTPNLMASFDVMDSHAYWHHPVFPGTAWDSNNWYVVNSPMVNHAEDATLPALSMQRVLGKPHAVTEYDHPAPNTFQVEGLWHLATYAALQDFDAVLQFDYAGDRNWAGGRISGYFDASQNPVQMVSMAPAAAAFLRGDLAPAQNQVVASVSGDQELDFLASRKAWWMPDAGVGGALPLESLIHRVAIATDGQSVPAGSIAPGATSVTGPLWSSDTGQIQWDVSDPAKGLIVVDAPRTKLLFGFGGGQTFDLSGLTVVPGPTLQQDFGALAFTVLDGTDFTTARSILVTALGTQQNTGAAWAAYPATALTFPPLMDTQVTFLNDQWGQSPTLVEGLTAEVFIPVPPSQVQVFALDATGARKTVLPVWGEGERARFEISPVYQTLWYEVEIAR